MLEINKTRARAVFKDLLGQANHFLITTLVGLNGVRSGIVTKDEEFRTSWNPRDVKRSADRSRFFVLDLALVRAVDSLDTYLMTQRRRPLALSGDEFINAMDTSGQKISRRLEVFNEFLKPLNSYDQAFLRLAIDWRNRRVHSLAEDNIDKNTVELLLADSERYSDRFSNLNMKTLVDDYREGSSPTFKDAAAIIRLVHSTVEHFDSEIIAQLNVENYLKQSIGMVLLPKGGNFNRESFMSPCNLIWGPRSKKELRLLRLLQLAGVSKVSEISGKEVPPEFVEMLQQLSPKSAVEFILS